MSERGKFPYLLPYKLVIAGFIFLIKKSIWYVFFLAVDDNPEYSDEDLGSSNDSSVGSSNDEVIKEDLITYTKNQLIELKGVSLSTQWPSYLDEGFKNNRGHWDPDRWHQNKRRGSTPPPEEKGGNSTNKDDVTAPGNKASLTLLFMKF